MANLELASTSESKSFFSLPSDEHTELVLRKVQSGELKLAHIDDGKYFHVFKIPNERLVVKILTRDLEVLGALSKADTRYLPGDNPESKRLTAWVDKKTLNPAFIATRNQGKATQLQQLALQYEVHKRFLGGHIIPKQFAIITLPHPILGSEVPSVYEKMLVPDSVQNPEVINPDVTTDDGKKGRIVEAKLRFGGKRHFFQENYQENTSLGKKFFIRVDQGEHVVEVQKELPFGSTDEKNSVLAAGVLEASEPTLDNKIWDQEFAKELLSLIKDLIAMLIAGVSIDSAYRKSRGANCCVVLDNGKKRIIFYDTNNWESSTKYRQLLTKQFNGAEVIDPYPGIDHAFVDYTLTDYLVIPLLENFKKAHQMGLFQLNTGITEEITRLTEKVKKLVDPNNTAEKIMTRNQPIVERKTQIEEKMNELYSKEEMNFDEERRLFDEQNELKLEVVPNLSKVLEILKRLKT